MLKLQILTGFLIFTGLLFLLSEDRRKIDWKLWAISPLLQLAIAFLLQKVPIVAAPIRVASELISYLDLATTKAAGFMFGYLAGATAPFHSVRPEAEFIVAFRVLPLILVISALSSLLYHWRVLPFIIEKLAVFFARILRLNAPLGFGVAASMFFGTIETPLVVKPYLAKMHRSDLFALITCSMATIAGSVMVLYAGLVEKVLPGAFGHLITASLLSIPASVMVARMLIPAPPETIPAAKTPHETKIRLESDSGSGFEALIRGTMEGLDMVMKIIAVIIVLFAMMYLMDSVLGALNPDLSLEKISGYILSPVMWLIGIPWSEAKIAGQLMGTKIVLNEFVAYLNLSQLREGTLSEGSTGILVYAMCGFANLGSVGIISGGLCSLLPQRKDEVISLCLKALLSGNIATLITAGITGLLF